MGGHQRHAEVPPEGPRGQRSPEHLGPPGRQRRTDTEEHRRGHDEVKMAHDEGRPVQHRVGRRGAEGQAREPPERKHPQRRDAVSERHRSTRHALPQRHEPAHEEHRRGQRHQQGQGHESLGEALAQTRGVEMVPVHETREQRHRGHGPDGGTIGARREARFAAQEVGHHAPHGQNHDVDRRVPEDPKQVLVHHRVAPRPGPRRGREEARPRDAVAQQQRVGAEEHREEHEVERARKHPRPRGAGKAPPGRPRAAPLDECHQEVEGAQEGPCGGQRDRDGPEGGAEAVDAAVGRQGREGRPARGGGAEGREGGAEGQREREGEAQRGEPLEARQGGARAVGPARHEGGAEPREEGRGGEVEHRAAVEGDEGRVHARRDHAVRGESELPAHGHRRRAAEHEARSAEGHERARAG